MAELTEGVAMPWNSPHFLERLNSVGNRYELENAWFSKKAWGDQVNYALNAWQIYRLTLKNPEGMLILGSAKIRKDEALLSNFGVASGGGITDPEELKLVKAFEAQRAASRAAGVEDVPKVVGSGSILNDKDWTPLLNDCFILGGVHGGHEFHLAEDNVDPHFSKLARSPLTIAEKWKDYFRANPGTFWDYKFGVPRILARELVGLKRFGYRPHLMAQQLSFSSPGAHTGTFVEYLDAVALAGILERNKARVFETVSQLIFGNGDALRGL
jgi:hypothetical protein